MNHIKTFRVFPNIPEELDNLQRIGRNLWWCWHPDALDLFRRLDIIKFSQTHHNPIELIGKIDQETYAKALKSNIFREHLDRVDVQLSQHLERTTWFQETYGGDHDLKVAYFSFEFGIHESLPIYSGGLGVLAGDHLKSASEMGIPLVGVGLAYGQGYFHQYLNAEGWQLETYPELDFYNMPMGLVKDDSGKPVTISVRFPGRKVFAQAWTVNVGRVVLYLLDTNIEDNSPEDRELTGRLYGGDVEHRVKQEYLLGVGGVILLDKLGVKPNVYHLNEGHAAFLSLARIEKYINEEGLSLKEAMEAVKSSNVFTTHTPVPAGNDRFDPGLVMKYFEDYCKRVSLQPRDFLGLGREDINNDEELFCMTVLALKLSSHCNGVSKLHGSISRNMWKNIWPDVPNDELPIQSITNGIHIRSWLSDEMTSLFNRYLGPTWVDESAHNMEVWERVDIIPPAELWRAKERLRVRLVSFVRKILQRQLRKRGATPSEIEFSAEVLDPEALTIGFARRFASYKRAALIFTDPDRLERILNNPEFPVQIIFSGKAHPADNIGKNIIKTLVNFAREERFRSKIVFIEDYDINVARYLVQGVDVWLNNPIRPREASGTSGMKVPPNGGLNCSILDGWWVEAYNGKNGWGIGSGEEYDDPAYQEQVESKLLYKLLEDEIVPKFYHRTSDGLPRDWIAMIKESMKTVCPIFNTNRMVQDYTNLFYTKAYDKSSELKAENWLGTKELVEYWDRVNQNWQKISIKQMNAPEMKDIKVGDKIEISVHINLGDCKPTDILVELYYGPLNNKKEISEGSVIKMDLEGYEQDGTYKYKCIMPAENTGFNGFGVRVIPYHKFQSRRFEPKRIIWG